MPVNPSNKRRRAAKATANDKVVINGVTHTAADGRFADLSGMYERDSYVSVETAIAIGARSGLDDFALDSVLETGSTTVSEVFSHDNDADAGSKSDTTVQKLVEAMAGFSRGDTNTEDTSINPAERSMPVFDLLSDS